MSLLLALLAACGPPPADGDRRRHAAALETLDRDPAAAAAACAQIGDAALAADCRWAAAEALAPGDSAAAAAICEDMRGAEADECWFLVAEYSDELGWCERAGGFELDCRMHLLTLALRALPPDEAPAELAARAADLMGAAGLDPAAPQLWTVVFRTALLRQRPLDRPSCLAVEDPRLQQVCLDTALQLFNDRLSQARDTGRQVCEGPLPAAASYLPDPELDRVLARRRAADLCDPTARRPPPPGVP